MLTNQIILNEVQVHVNWEILNIKLILGGTLSAPFWCLSQNLSLPPLCFNKTSLHKSSERSSLISGPGLNLSSPASLHDSATTFHLGASSGILQDKMGANNSSLSPLNCILKNWDRFDPQGLKKTHLVFLCDTAEATVSTGGWRTVASWRVS